MRVETYDDARAFLEDHEDWLCEDEASNSTLIGIARRCVDGYESGWFGVVLDASGRRVSAVWRTPPYVLGLIHGSSDAIRAVHDHVREHDPDFDGFNGPAESCDAFGLLCARAGMGESRTTMEQMLFRLDAVEDRGSAPGSMRLAGPEDEALALEWAGLFAEDAGIGNSPRVARQMRMVLEREQLRLWIDDGTPACMAAVARETRNGATVNWVFTPRSKRGRGYATSLVAALSQSMLDRGKSFCTLYTDLTNPTSNGIYKKIGYREIGRHRKVDLIR